MSRIRLCLHTGASAARLGTSQEIMRFVESQFIRKSLVFLRKIKGTVSQKRHQRNKSGHFNNRLKTSHRRRSPTVENTALPFLWDPL